MRKAVFLRFVAVIAITAIICSLVSAMFFAASEEKQVRENLSQLCEIAAHEYKADSDASALSDILGNERVTIIAADGTVLSDSAANANDMENHMDRDEVKHAREGTVTTATRQSGTLSRPFMYAATKLSDGNIIRLAHSYGGILRSMAAQLQSLLIAVVLAVIFAIFAANAFTKRVIKPLEAFADNLSAGNYEALNQGNNYYEIDRITGKINELLIELMHVQRENENERDKVNFILSNMDEGFVLIDENQHIQLIDASAKRIFDCQTDVIGQSILMLTRNTKIESAVNHAVTEHIASMFDLPMHNTVYSIHVAPILEGAAGTKDIAATILMIDVGEQRASQQQRSEFFSNASHELKTPITSVMGFAEMLHNGMLGQDEQQRISERIYNETKRMNHLIDDILTISRLESGVATEQIDHVNISDVAREVAEALAPQAQDQGIHVQLHCQDDVSMSANRRQIHELLSNLIENAIKYNNHGGSVDIEIKSELDKVRICVKDTGVGIPSEAQSRIFERFYRVDNGRSKSVGGTGLGLSIVKHIVASLDGEVALKSQIGSGTEVMVMLPMKKQML